ncbi:uroporphyrinogen-III C-methyltransferase [Aliivibrio sp. EL58]|uniref:uroporphyrinogen-III C-methyltransferase n=1 Tax=Aliivibrio sp. EL58 TaxID=2107582 RepID=UPI000EFB46AE|nr:uroporphyrinogen-III C-methyltransferase [Aliivibrio sp. EL58]
MTIKSQYNNKGHAYIVGAGTGDPELLTVKAARIIAYVDVVIYDNLVSQEILDLIPPCSELVYVGKTFNTECHCQSEINDEIIKHIQIGKSVCRLKGGDPFVFGRGGEEAIALQELGISFEVIPGITAAIGCCSYAGIPTTHRGISSGVTIVTGRDQFNSDHIHWRGLVQLKHTIVFYMGLHKSDIISKNLINNGMSANTPTAIISNGTRSNQSIITCELGLLAETVEVCKPLMPAIIVVGQVVNLSKAIEWFPNERAH